MSGVYLGDCRACCGFIVLCVHGVPSGVRWEVSVSGVPVVSGSWTKATIRAVRKGAQSPAEWTNLFDGAPGLQVCPRCVGRVRFAQLARPRSEPLASHYLE